MSSQSASGRREAALAAAAQLGPMREDVAEAIEQQRERYAQKRAARVQQQPPPQEQQLVERRVADRRSGPFDRREAERRSASAYPASDAESDRIDRRKFKEQPELPSAFGDDV